MDGFRQLDHVASDCAAVMAGIALLMPAKHYPHKFVWMRSKVWAIRGDTCKGNLYEGQVPAKYTRHVAPLAHYVETQVAAGTYAFG